MMRFKFSPQIKPRSALFCSDTIVKGVMVNYGNLIKLLWSSSRDINIKSNAQSKFNYLVLEVTDGKMDLNLYFCLVVMSFKISITFQESIKNNDIGSLIEQLVKPSDDYNENRQLIKTNTPGNNSRIIYFKTVTEPKVIKRQSGNVEDVKIDMESPDFLYDDADDYDQSSFRRNENNRTINKINGLQNFEKQVEATAAPELIAEGKSHNSNEKTKSPVERSGILPDFVIDQIVYEESESNVNLKSTIEELEKKITSHNEKEKHKFSRIFQEIKNLYNEIEELKKIQEQISRTQEILTRRDNSANERSSNALNLPTQKVCSKIKPVRYPMQHPKHWVNPFVGRNPIVNANNRAIMPFPPNLPYLRTIPSRFSSNFNNNQRFVQHNPLFKYFH